MDSIEPVSVDIKDEMMVSQEKKWLMLFSLHFEIFYTGFCF